MANDRRRRPQDPYAAAHAVFAPAPPADRMPDPKSSALPGVRETVTLKIDKQFIDSVDADDKQWIRPGSIYLAPANYHLLVQEGEFSLAVDEAVAYSRPSIDVLFESAAEAYGEPVVYERHRHRFEFNNHYRDRLAEAGMMFSGTSPNGRLVEIIELRDHPFFVGSQFHPEFRSRPNRPHPLFRDFMRAAAARADAIAQPATIHVTGMEVAGETASAG